MALANPARYSTLHVRLDRVLASWRLSIMAHPYLGADGQVKADVELSPERLTARQSITKALQNQQALPMPVLGIGMFENVEIGVGADTLVTLAWLGHTTMPVHVLTSQINEFKEFLATTP